MYAVCRFFDLRSINEGFLAYVLRSIMGRCLGIIKWRDKQGNGRALPQQTIAAFYWGSSKTSRSLSYVPASELEMKSSNSRAMIGRAVPNSSLITYVLCRWLQLIICGRTRVCKAEKLCILCQALLRYFTGAIVGSTNI
jgi:hypothetical protein